MKQSQFMYELMKELSDMPDRKKIVIMNDYTQLFTERMEQGISEDDIIKSLATPKEIAQGYKNGTPLPIEGIESVYTDEQGYGVTFGSLVKFIILLPVAIVYDLLTATLGLAVLTLCLALCIASVCLSVFSFTVASLQVGFILLGLGSIFFTLAFLFLCVVIVKGTLRVVIAFPKYTGRVLKSGKKAGGLV